MIAARGKSYNKKAAKGDGAMIGNKAEKTMEKTMSLLCSALMAVSLAFGASEPQEACKRRAADGNASSSSILKIGTYNILQQNAFKGSPYAWANRKDDLVALLRKMDLDVCGLQEVCPGQADYLTNALPQYALAGAHREDGMRKGEASPVLYKKGRFEVVKGGTFWLSETPDVPGSKSWGTAHTRVCSWMRLKDRNTGKTLCFVNAHTDTSVLARKEGMSLIVRRMNEIAPSGTPVVFTGDHNCHESSEPAKAVSRLLKNALYISETAPTGPWRTYNARKCLDREPSTLDILNSIVARHGWNRIDYIYVSEGVRVRSYATHGDVRPGTRLYPSDHFPITAEIEL